MSYSLHRRFASRIWLTMLGVSDHHHPWLRKRPANDAFSYRRTSISRCFTMMAKQVDNEHSSYITCFPSANRDQEYSPSTYPPPPILLIFPHSSLQSIGTLVRLRPLPIRQTCVTFQYWTRARQWDRPHQLLNIHCPICRPRLRSPRHPGIEKVKP